MNISNKLLGTGFYGTAATCTGALSGVSLLMGKITGIIGLGGIFRTLGVVSGAVSVYCGYRAVRVLLS